MQLRLVLCVLFGVVAGCGQRPEPLLPEHFGADIRQEEARGPRVLVATLRTDGAMEAGKLVILPGDGEWVVGGAIDVLPAGRYGLMIAAAAQCAETEGSEWLGAFSPDAQGQSRFSLNHETAEPLQSLTGRQVQIAAMGVDGQASVVGCGVLEPYGG